MMEDQYLKWCQDHQTEIQQHPNCFLAISLQEDKIVYFEEDHIKFQVWLEQLSIEQLRKIYTTHSSIYGKETK